MMPIASLHVLILLKVLARIVSSFRFCNRAVADYVRIINTSIVLHRDYTLLKIGSKGATLQLQGLSMEGPITLLLTQLMLIIQFIFI